MIQSQGYWMNLACSDCGDTEEITAEGKVECVKAVRAAGWSLSSTSHACWCPVCKKNHTAQARNKFKIK